MWGDPGGRPWYISLYYATGRAFAHIFRLSWYGKGPGVWETCRQCEGMGTVILPDLRPAFLPHVNAVPCRPCAGLGRRMRTNGVL